MEMDEASTVLGVPRNASLEVLRRRYRSLVKKVEDDGCGRGSRQLHDVSIAYTKLLSLHAFAGSTSANKALRVLGASSTDQASHYDADMDVDVGEMKAFMTVIRELLGVFSTSAPTSLGRLPLLFGVSAPASASSATIGAAACDSDDSDGLLKLSDSGSDDDGFYSGTWPTTDDNEGCTSSSSSSSWSWLNADWTGLLLGLLSRLTGIYMVLGTGVAGGQGNSVHSGLSLGLAGYGDDVDVDGGGGGLDDKDRPKKTKRRHDRRKKLKERKAAEAAVAAAAECTEELTHDSARENMARAQDELSVSRRELFLSAARGDVSGLEYMLGPESCVSAKGCGLRVTEVCDGSLGEEFGGEMEGRSLQHFCLTGVATPGPSQWREGPLRAERLACLELLVSRSSPSVSLCAAGKGDITVLHLAAQRADATALQWLLDVPVASSPDHPTASKGGSSGSLASHNPKRMRDERFRVKMSDINQRCSLRGFTPLHYAAEAGVVASVRSLVEVGALLNIHAVVSGSKAAERGPTPLELVAQMLHQIESCGSSRSNSGAVAPKSALRAVRDVLAEAVASLEALRRSKEEDAAVEAAACKEQTREKTRSKNVTREPPSRPRLGSKDSVGSMDSGGGRYKERARTGSSGGMVTVTATSAIATDEFADMGDGTGAGEWEVTAKKKRRSRASTRGGTDSGTGTDTGTGTGTASSIGSEPTLAAASRKGVPSLAVRPADSADVGASTAAAAAIATATARGTPYVTLRDTGSVASTRPPSAVGVNDTAPGGSVAPSPEELLRIEHDRREEQRRINRAWNAKAEEEKRRADAERGRQERDRAQSQRAQQTKHTTMQYVEAERMRAHHPLGKSVQGSGPRRGPSHGQGSVAPHGGSFPALSDYGGVGAVVKVGGGGSVGDGGPTAMRAPEQGGMGAFGAVFRDSPIPQHAQSHAHAHSLPGNAAAFAAMPAGPAGGQSGPGSSSFGSIPAFGPMPRRAPRQVGGVHPGGGSELHISSRGDSGVGGSGSSNNSSSSANMGAGVGAGAGGAHGGHGPESLAGLPEDMRLALMNMPAFEQATPVSKRNASGSSRTDRYNPLVDSPHQQQVHALAQQQLKMQQHSKAVSAQPSGMPSLGRSSLGGGLLSPPPQSPEGCSGALQGVLGVQGALEACLSSGDGIDLSAGAYPFVPLFDDAGAALDLMRPPGMAPGRPGPDRGGHNAGAGSKHGSNALGLLASSSIDLTSLSARLSSGVGAPFRGGGESTASHGSESYAVDDLLDVDVSALALDFLDGGKDEGGGSSQY